MYEKDDTCSTLVGDRIGAVAQKASQVVQSVGLGGSAAAC